MNIKDYKFSDSVTEICFYDGVLETKDSITWDIKGVALNIRECDASLYPRFNHLDISVMAGYLGYELVKKPEPCDRSKLNGFMSAESDV